MNEDRYKILLKFAQNAEEAAQQKIDATKIALPNISFQYSDISDVWTEQERPVIDLIIKLLHKTVFYITKGKSDLNKIFNGNANDSAFFDQNRKNVETLSKNFLNNYIINRDKLLANSKKEISANKKKLIDTDIFYISNNIDHELNNLIKDVAGQFQGNIKDNLNTYFNTLKSFNP